MRVGVEAAVETLARLEQAEQEALLQAAEGQEAEPQVAMAEMEESEPEAR